MQPESRWLVVSMHDVAPATWSGCQRVLDAVAEVAQVPLTLLVVPAYHGKSSAQPEFERQMSDFVAAGHELALHGYSHRDDQQPNGWIDRLRRRAYTAGEGEFSGLSKHEAARRLQLGRHWFAANGWPSSGFVAPAWLLGPGAWQALRASSGFDYTTTLTRFHLLRERIAFRAPCLAYSTRSRWRRLTSRAWNRALFAATTTTPILRLSLHPNDAEDAPVRRSWQQWLRAALVERRPVTKATLASELRASARAAHSTAATGTRTAGFRRTV